LIFDMRYLIFDIRMEYQDIGILAPTPRPGNRPEEGASQLALEIGNLEEKDSQ